MTTKEKLEQFFSTESNEKKLIATYEENIIFFNYLLNNGDTEDLDFVIYVKIYKYASLLQNEGYYSKALIVTDEIERDLEKLKEHLKWYDIYSQSVTFLKGICQGRLKKYRESNKYLKELIKKDPANERYVDWYKSNLKHRINDVSGNILLVGGILFFVHIILSAAKILPFKTPLFVNISLFTIMLIAFIFPWVSGKIIDKLKIPSGKEKRGKGK